MKYAIGKPFVPDGSSLGGDFWIPSSVSAGGQLISSWGPVGNVRDEHLQRSVRFTTGGTTGGRTITFTFGSSAEADAVFVEGLNVSSITINGTALTCDLNPRTGRYQRFHEPATGASSTWAIILASSSATGDSFLECGRISIVKSGSLQTMPTNACWGQPFNVSVDSLGSERMMASGESLTANMSLNFIRVDLQGLFLSSQTSTTAHPYAFARMKRDERVMLFENRSSDTNKVYCHLLKKIGEASISEEFPYLDFSVPMQEVI